MTVVLVKFVHILAIAGWSACLVCLPFLYLQRRRLAGDGLYQLHAFTRAFYVVVMSPAAFVAVASGTALIFLQSVYAPWFSAKLALVGVMVGIHVLNGLMILRLFEPGQSYPFRRFLIVTTLAVTVVTAILVLVLGKPDLARLMPATDIFEPGALQQMATSITAWSR